MLKKSSIFVPPGSMMFYLWIGCMTTRWTIHHFYKRHPFVSWFDPPLSSIESSDPSIFTSTKEIFRPLKDSTYSLTVQALETYLHHRKVLYLYITPLGDIQPSPKSQLTNNITVVLHPSVDGLSFDICSHNPSKLREDYLYQI